METDERLVYLRQGAKQQNRRDYAVVGEAMGLVTRLFYDADLHPPAVVTI